MNVASLQQRRQEQHRLIRPETLRALAEEHRELIVSARALTTLMREPMGDATEEHILARILDAELNQIEVLDGELMTALRVERGDRGARARLDLSNTVAAMVRRSGRLTLVEYHGRVPVMGHRRIIEQLVDSVLALAHRWAEGAVCAWAESEEGGGGSVVVTTSCGGDDVPLGARIELLKHLAKETGGELTIERDGEQLKMRARFGAA